MTSTNGTHNGLNLDLDLDLDLDIDDIPIQIQDAQLSHLSPSNAGSGMKDVDVDVDGMEREHEHGLMDWQDIGSNGEDMEFDFNSAFPTEPSSTFPGSSTTGIGLNIPPPSSINIPFSSPQLLQGPGFGTFPGQGDDAVRVKPEPQSPIMSHHGGGNSMDMVNQHQRSETPLSAGPFRTATPISFTAHNNTTNPGSLGAFPMNMNMNMNGFPPHGHSHPHPQSFMAPTPMQIAPGMHQPFFPPLPPNQQQQAQIPLVDINGNLTVPSSALWPNSMSLPNPSNFPMPSIDSQLAPNSAAVSAGQVKAQRRASVANTNSNGNGSGNGNGKSDSRPKKRPRTSRSRSASVKVQSIAPAVSTPAGKNANVNNNANTNTSPSADAGDAGSDSDSEGEMDVEMEMEEMLAEARDRASSCGSGQSLVSGFASGMGMGMGMTANGGGEDGVDGMGVKFKNKPFAPSKKKKIPPPGGFKPWNTSPASSHLPSGSACINPVTGEVELPPMDNLTKEEIRKVKNRASAQRSRTRKGELLGGLMDEVNRLRDRLKEVTGGREGGEDEIPEEVVKKRGGSFKSGTPSGSAGDEEREGMKMLIDRLRGEVERERNGRESAEREVRDLRARLLGSVVPVENSAMDDEDELVEIQPHLDAAALKPREAVVEKTAEKKKDKVIVKGTQRESKGVLMMVVLFSFALFSIPPHLRAPGYHTSTAFQMHGSELTTGLLGGLVPSDEPGKRQPMKGRKSLSFTLLKPINEEKPSELEPSEDVEDVLEKWIGLSLFDEKQEEPEPAIPGGWVVVKSGKEASQSPKESLGGESPKAPMAWDGTPLESMQLDDDIMSASLSHDQMDLLPFTPDNRQSHGPSPTLAPEFQGDPLAEEEARQRASSVPLVAPTKASLRRQSMSVLGQGPSLTSSRSVSVPSALMASTSGRYMKLELEIDFEVEMTCKGIKRGADCVGIEEAGRLIDSGLTLGKDGNFLSLARS